MFELQEDIDVQKLYRPLYGEVLPGTPTMDTESEEYLFWDKHIRRCLKGWVEPTTNKFINGIQYFANNFVRADYFDESTKRACKSELLLWRDNDNEVTDVFWGNLPRRLKMKSSDEITFKNAQSHIEIKARRKGFTYMDLVDNLYMFVFYPDYPIASAYPSSKEKNISEEREMFKLMWRNLPPIFRRWRGMDLEIGRDNISSDSMCVFEVGFKIGTKKIDTHNFWQQGIVSADPKKAGIFKGNTYRKISVVEAGEWTAETLKSFVALNKDSLSFGSYQVGRFNIGGTSTNITADWTDYQEIYYDEETYPYTRHMTPAYMVAQGFWNRKTGLSDKKAALEFYLNRRKSIEKNADALHREMAENPIHTSDFFMSSTNTTYDVTKINLQIDQCKLYETHKRWVRGKLVEDLDLNGHLTGVHFQEDPEGEWMVHREFGMPSQEYKDLYVGTIDDKFKSQNINTYDKNKSSHSCMVIFIREHNFDFPSNRPIAFMVSPSFNLNNTFDEFYKGILFWDIEKTTYEYSSQGFVTYMESKNETHRLMYYGEQPGFVLTGKGKARNEVTLLGNQAFEKGFYKNIDNIEILESFKKWNDKKNTDIGSCVHLYFKHMKETKYIQVTRKETEAKRTGLSTNFVILGSQAPETGGKKIVLGSPNTRKQPTYRVFGQ